MTAPRGGYEEPALPLPCGRGSVRKREIGKDDSDGPLDDAHAGAVARAPEMRLPGNSLFEEGDERGQGAVGGLHEGDVAEAGE